MTLTCNIEMKTKVIDLKNVKICCDEEKCLYISITYILILNPES